MPRITKIFGELTFSLSMMKEKLSKDVYQTFVETLQSGKPLEEATANEIAHCMKEWAIANGATHFTHWFQPQRGGTAEKHDAFISYTEDGELIERFSAKQLIQSEPDASSFPSGGIRSTFEARGYTAWDPSSPAFLKESGNNRTLVIPSVFLSWTGDVLDRKTPLLRSIKTLSDVGIKLQRLLGNRSAKKLIVYAGPEQEYFVISKKLFDSRPDLRICGRTLFGAPPAKGQQMEDHYFGSIAEKMIVFMSDLDTELYRHGIPAKTRHNEVSPNQFELAPLYEEANLAIDHNMLTMDIMRSIAAKHDLVVLLHEKPFARVNGSGKHLNWSVGDNTVCNYLEPSASPIKNMNFLLTLGAVLLGVKNHGGLLRACVADAGNDYRLGGHEAPPAIMSVYLGDYLTKILDEIEGIRKPTDRIIANINMGVRNIPKISKDYSDRNRTSPIAFTGDKFEFRAVGSSQNCSEAATIFNMMVADGLSEIIAGFETYQSDDIKENALLVLRDVFQKTRQIRFEGNGYSEDWHNEAAKRGLPHADSTPAALKLYLSHESFELHKSLKVLSERELHAKVDIKLETYIKTKEIEFKTAVNITRTRISPAILEYLNRVASTLMKLSSGPAAKTIRKELSALEVLYTEISENTEKLEEELRKASEIGDPAKRAEYLAKHGESALGQLRIRVDEAEEILPDSLWPMAKYQELLTLL